VLRSPSAQDLLDVFSRPRLADAVRLVLARARQRMGDNPSDPPDVSAACPSSGAESVLNAARLTLEAEERAGIAEVINATGIIVHTGLGRSVLSKQACEALARAASRPCALELDLETGQRGSRDAHVNSLLCRLTGAAAATAVNNNAAAVALAVNTLAAGREVIISRGQLVEIGASFRMPDVIRHAGACLVEAGTTNRTRVEDYEKAITSNTALILWVHTSNYRIVGFSEEVQVEQLVELGKRNGLPVMADLGSGALLDLSRFGVGAEPIAQQILAAGADIVTFSGDKLLGGPQAGIILARQASGGLGQPDFIARMKKNPLMRVVRVDKLTLAALEATLGLYLDADRALSEIPTLRMIVEPAEKVRERAEALADALAADEEFAKLARVSVEQGSSQVGGGALPTENIPTWLVALEPLRVSDEELARRLRTGSPPVVARVHRGRVLLDLRTVLPEQMDALREALLRAAG
jgi:L-seryl-tRNA(Ser) seleniumtransferase